MQENQRPKTAGNGASSRLPGRGRRSLRSAFGAFWKRKFLVIAAFLVLSAAICGLHYVRNLHTAGTVLSLDYEEASKGLTPNRMRFNIFEIQSGEVMERLIEAAGLKGKATPEELSRCVSVQATHVKNVRGYLHYISTSFVCRFT